MLFMLFMLSCYHAFYVRPCACDMSCTMYDCMMWYHHLSLFPSSFFSYSATTQMIFLLLIHLAYLATIHIYRPYIISLYKWSYIQIWIKIIVLMLIWIFFQWDIQVETCKENGDQIITSHDISSLKHHMTWQYTLAKPCAFFNGMLLCRVVSCMHLHTTVSCPHTSIHLTFLLISLVRLPITGLLIVIHCFVYIYYISCHLSSLYQHIHLLYIRYQQHSNIDAMKAEIA